MTRVNVPRKGHGGVWRYPSVTSTLKEAGLQTVEKYIKLRRDTVAMWIVDRPLYKACVEGKRKRGTSARRQWWWEQPMGLESDEELLVDQVARNWYYARDNGQVSRRDREGTSGGKCGEEDANVCQPFSSFEF